MAYWREAWTSPQGNSVRVTIDRQVRGEPRAAAVFSTQMRKPVYPFGKQLVLELKFTDRFAGWFKDLVQHFDLFQSGAPTECGSVADAGEQRVAKVHPNGIRQKLAEMSNFC